MNPVFYFSGTGGSLSMTKTVCEKLTEFTPVPIAALAGEKTYKVNAESVGLVFPLYYAGLPAIVAEFVKKLEFEKSCYVFAAVTCGFPWSGYALHQIKGLLRKKGQKLSAGFYIKMVDNYLPHFDMPGAEDQETIAAKANEKLDTIIESVSKREKKIEHEKALWLYPSYLIYMPLLKRYDRFYTADENCNSCGRCQSVCPVNNVELKDGKPQWLNHCEFCLACIHYCPKKAIQWKDITEKKGRYHYKGISAAEIAKQKAPLNK
jgi:ferredoxin